jgi:hypothetical protein
MHPWPLLTAAGLPLLTLAAPTTTTTTTNHLLPRQGGGGCKKIHFIFARGSTETGTMGITVGPAFSRALSSRFGASNVHSEGVPYPADIAGAFSGGVNPSGAAGAIKMTAMARAAWAKCPQTKIVLGGYSQGAEQVHGALAGKNLGLEGAKIAVCVFVLSFAATCGFFFLFSVAVPASHCSGFYGFEAIPFAL